MLIKCIIFNSFVGIPHEKPFGPLGHNNYIKETVQHSTPLQYISKKYTLLDYLLRF